MKSIIFVYNANSGFWSKNIDFAHKIISPATYSCSLCALTHGKFKQKEEWRNFRENSPVNIDFLYKNDFLAKNPGYKGTFPVVFLKKLDGNLEVVMDNEVLKQLDTAKQLIVGLQLRLKTLI